MTGAGTSHREIEKTFHHEVHGMLIGLYNYTGKDSCHFPANSETMDDIIFVQKRKIALTFELNAAEKKRYSKKASNKSFSALNFVQKSPRGHTSSPGVELGSSKDNMVEILNGTETEKYIHFWAERCQKYALFLKSFK